MIITQTQRAIEFYELAIENAQTTLGFQVNQDEAYQKFQAKYKKLGFTTLYHKHSQEFAFYSYRDSDDREHYFKIDDGEIVYKEQSHRLANVEEIAAELLSIVGKFL